MFEKDIIEKFIYKISLRQYEQQKVEPIYGIVVDTNSERDKNGYVIRINDIEIVYLLDGRLCHLIVSLENAYLGCFPVYPGIVVKFCSDQLNDNEIIRKINNSYIMRLDRDLDGNFPKEVYEVVKIYVESIEVSKLDPIFWHNLGLIDQGNRNILLKR